MVLSFFILHSLQLFLLFPRSIVFRLFLKRFKFWQAWHIKNPNICWTDTESVLEIQIMFKNSNSLLKYKILKYILCFDTVYVNLLSLNYYRIFCVLRWKIQNLAFIWNNSKNVCWLLVYFFLNIEKYKIFCFSSLQINMRQKKITASVSSCQRYMHRPAFCSF